MDNRQQIDKQLPEIGENSGANANANGKSITNIYYDCLERIFEFLDLNSLLNVANTCKHLQIAAAAYYGDVHGKHRVDIAVHRRYREIKIDYFNGAIDLQNFKYHLQFLRCFGPKILHLDVTYDCLNDNNYVDRYINQYCAKTLKSIKFRFCPKFSIANFPNPFECVEEVSLRRVKLKDQLPHFINLFPKLRKLYYFCDSVDGHCTDAHFPNLEDLIIVIIEREEGFMMKNVEELLHANPQLQNLSISIFHGQEMTVNELLNTISQNPSITKLTLWNHFFSNINPVDLMRFASERPHTVELELLSHRIPPQDAINFIRQLKLLKKFRFTFNDQADYDQLVSQLDSEWKHELKINSNGALFIILNR